MSQHPRCGLTKDFYMVIKTLQETWSLVSFYAPWKLRKPK